MSARDDIHLLEDDVYLAKYLEIARQKFEEGNKAIILRAMNHWLEMKRPVPEWLRLAFIKVFQQATAFEIRSWDEVFGPAVEPGAHLGPRNFPWRYLRKFSSCPHSISCGDNAIDLLGG